MFEYQFVCMDAQGRWLDLRNAKLTGLAEAKEFARGLLAEFVAVVVYEGAVRAAVLARLSEEASAPPRTASVARRFG